MKNVFGRPYSDNGQAPFDGERFVTASLDDNFKRTREKIYSKAKMTREAVTLPIIANAIAWASFAIFAIIAFMFFKDVYKLGVDGALENEPIWLLSVGAAGFVVWLVLKLIEYRNGKKDEETGDYDRALESLANIKQAAEDRLGIPPDYTVVDIMSCRYKPAKGKLDGEYLNEDMKLFSKDDCLCLADIDSVYSFPIKDFVRYYLGSEKLPLAIWNKEENYDEGEYLQYGIKTKYTDMACLCYSLQFVCDSEVYEIIFPEYELEHFQKLVDVPVEFDE